MPFMLALKYDTNATVLVISPLKILQDDQASRFRDAGIAAAAVNGDTYSKVKQNLEALKYRALLTSPEMCLENDAFRKFLTSSDFQRSIRAVIIDEAHCIGQWGGDFRKHYGSLNKLRALFPATVPFLAATATLPPKALNEVCDKLHIDLDESYFINLGNDRPNITQHVRFIDSAHDYSALKELLSVNAKKPDDIVKTIVFVNSRNGTQEVCREVRKLLPRHLRKHVDFLHAVRKDRTKRRIMRRFRNGRIRILIATEAAGMGADIPDIIQVIQLGAPRSLSIYLQRAGRAVRNAVLQGRAYLLMEKSAFRLQKKKKPKKKAADDWSDDDADDVLANDDLNADCDVQLEDGDAEALPAVDQSDDSGRGDGVGEEGNAASGDVVVPCDDASRAAEVTAGTNGGKDGTSTGVKKPSRTPDSQMTWGKVIDLSLRKYVTESTCRRVTSDTYFDNPPGRRAPTGSCCDVCEGTAPPIPGSESATVPTPITPETALTSAHPTETSLSSTPTTEMLDRPSTPVQSRQTTPASTPQKDGKRPLVRRKYGPARKGDLLKRVRAALERWRGVTRARDFPYSTLPAKALLSDQSLTKLASNNKIVEPADLATLEPPWVYHNKYGVEVLALIQKVVFEFESERNSNKKPRRTGRPKKTAAQQLAACSPEAMVAAEAKQVRAAERDHARLAKAEREETKRLAKEARERAMAEKDARKALYAANYAKRHAVPAPPSRPTPPIPTASAAWSPSFRTFYPSSPTTRYPLTPAGALHPALAAGHISSQGSSLLSSFPPRLSNSAPTAEASASPAVRETHYSMSPYSFIPNTIHNAPSNTQLHLSTARSSRPRDYDKTDDPFVR
ncbi:P-loop containing nucleoside triphosphate hydrolase protein [Schizophyllum commune H4-8]|uniref:P-loop containing nucleoside triphosphate hydrolase protein n=1 Tax=Schizophyllum commune (strain H4-8 / FGSC 9210) TaxID=578458 RepID=UPI00215F9134|nr:P-loop containing nucleoside triphosphate hydrolase protein [Schizophyllum commune H4-8]XP_003031482.2 P-loop containing nucleoside triphosphate hydrolase protein [Schizophyllum commune H4-8]KAI5891101.1 P-loop containing nucleoside triphosphate hydrolase protein [Schizophyllum commune H4-8]KAI5891137.1 P-loop containing nucleoside triphosphate hydrolase protein [Schizophyllum commune H4-8]